MQRSRIKDYIVPSGLGLALVLLVIAVIQMQQMQRRLITQGQQLERLGEATERLSAAGGVRVRESGPSTAAPAPDPNVKFLHPEVENFLKPRDTHWPPPGAALDGVLKRGWPSGDPKGFNSYLENAADLMEGIQTYVALPIAQRNEWTNPDIWHAALAHRVEITDDSKEFTIYLRKGVKWHPVSNVDLQGKFAWLKGDHEVTARDLVFTLDMIMHPQVESGPHKNFYVELESWKAPDPHVFVVRWKKKQFTNLEQTLTLFPLPEFVYAYDQDGKRFPKETIGLRFNQHWYNNKGFMGSGPYRMTAYQPGVKIELARNEAFIDEKPAIARIEYPIYTDPSQTVLKLKSRELTFGSLTPAQYRQEIQQYEGKQDKPKDNPFLDGRIHCQKATPPGWRFIGWNMERPVFKDKRVRRAMSHAFNRRQIIDSVFAGLGVPISGPFLPDATYNDPSVKSIPFDLEAAKRLLAEAGWSDSDGDGVVDKKLNPGDAKPSPFEFTLLIYGTSQEWAALANIFREDLLKIGVKMKIDAAEWSLLQKRTDEKNFDAVTGGWTMGWDVDLYQIWHSSQADIPKGSNKVSFRNKEADELIEKLRVTFDTEERNQLVRAFHRIVAEEQPYSYFMVQQGVYCAWREVKNVQFAKLRPLGNSLPWWVAPSGG